MKKELITSRKNKIIKEAAQLLQSADNRTKSGLYIIEGARLCEDAAKSGVKIQKSFVTHRAAERYYKYIKSIDEVCGQAYIIEEHIAQLLSQTKSNQGVFALCEMGEDRKPSFKGKLVALENVQDPSNLGTVMRTAEALGLNGIILLGKCCDIYSPKVLRSSMGAVFRMPVYKFEESTKLFVMAKKLGSECYAAVPDDSARHLGEFHFPEDSIVFIGNEGNGLSSELLILCKNKVTIPMKGRAESLNAAASAAIIMWEMSK